MKRRKTDIRCPAPVKKAFIISAVCVICFLSSVFGLLPAISANAQQDDVIQFIEKKQKELKQREDYLDTEEKKLNTLKKDMEEKTARYTKLLNDLENKLKEIEKIRSERLDYIVKVYEGMPPEDAAAKLNALDDQTASEIITRMKSKKAGAVMSYMDERKAASITYSITRFEKKIPRQ
jgi:flagellar motility protein MotE (MotC chaperone)